MPYVQRGFGAATQPQYTGPQVNYTLIEGGAAVIAALIFLPGIWKLLVPAGLIGLMVAGNWQQCSQDAADATGYLMDNTTGQPAPIPAPGIVVPPCPTGHNCSWVQPVTMAMPQASCLFNPFPGGL